jgi:hypothetical protein
MQKRQTQSSIVAIAAALVLASTGTLLANGQTFFLPADRGPVDLVYFARVKDARTGRLIQAPPNVTIVDPYTGLYFPFAGDGPGHFRSPDIGAAIKALATQPIDTGQLEIKVSALGYKTVKVENIPRRSKGTIELDVRMEPTRATGDNAPPATGAASRLGAAEGRTSAPADSAKPTIFLLGTCFGLAAIAAVARTVDRPDSRGH